MQSQPASILGTITSTAVITEVTWVILFYQLGVLCIFDIFLRDMQIYLNFDLINANDT